MHLNDNNRYNLYVTGSLFKSVSASKYKIGACAVVILNGLQHKKTCLQGFANSKCADQPAHMHSLIGAFVVHIFQSSISKLATGEISIF